MKEYYVARPPLHLTSTEPQHGTCAAMPLAGCRRVLLFGLAAIVVLPATRNANGNCNAMAAATAFSESDSEPELEMGRGLRTKPNGFEPLLFMALDDVVEPYGLVWPTANTVAPSATYKPPPLNYTQGDLVIGVIASATVAGQFEVYAENTTGKEPIHGVLERSGDNPTHATTSQPRFTCV